MLIYHRLKYMLAKRVSHFYVFGGFKLNALEPVLLITLVPGLRNR